MKLGLVRGGQLGYMLIEAGMPYADHFFVLDSDEHSPCRNFCKDFTHGDPLDPDVMETFGKNLDAVMVEFEHVSTEGLKRLEEAGVKVYPQASVLEAIQDKGLQKQFFQEKDLPTSGFECVENKESLVKNLKKGPFILKKRKGGYDGKGVVKVEKLEDIPEDWTEDLLVETLVPIQKELAVVVARDKEGKMAVYPTVEMVFYEHQNMLDMLVSPARVTEEVEKEAEEIAKKTAEAYGIVGILAVELFLTKDGKVLINEVAPRVHNSGHCTMESAQSSQFDQLLRIVHGLPLGDTSLLSPVAMVNVVGHPEHRGPAKYRGLEEVLDQPDVFVHLYNKEETRPYRKMGHVTVLGQTVEKAMTRARMVQKNLTVES